MSDARAPILMNVEAKEVKVRMYRLGVGDCFLLAFPTDLDAPYFVMIDCGVVKGTPESTVPSVKEVLDDIRAVTGGEIHLLVITHEHWDHYSGFLNDEHIAGFTIHNLWLPWTEDPNHPLANRLRADFQKDLKGLQLALGGREDHPALAGAGGLLSFFGDLGAAPDGTVQGPLAKIRERWEQKTNGRPKYCRPAEGPLALPGTRTRRTHAARVYVLGPPEDERLLRRIDPTVRGGEVVDELSALTPRRAFRAAFADQAGLAADDPDLRERSYPFPGRVRMPIPSDDWRKHPDKHVRGYYQLFDECYGLEHLRPEGEETSAHPCGWRRIGEQWLGTAERLALHLDNYTNNTSLVLAFELVESGKVLLFVGDAQVGNWSSWADLRWPWVGSSPLPVDDDDDVGADTDENGDGWVSATELLRHTVLYKVGHHGSHNATVDARRTSDGQSDPWGLALMTDEELVAMLPVNEQVAHEKKHWLNMPYPPLVRELERRTRGRLLRADRRLSPEPPTGVDEREWTRFRNSGQLVEDDRFVQYLVHDRRRRGHARGRHGRAEA